MCVWGQFIAAMELCTTAFCLYTSPYLQPPSPLQSMVVVGAAEYTFPPAKLAPFVGEPMEIVHEVAVFVQTRMVSGEGSVQLQCSDAQMSKV